MEMENGVRGVLPRTEICWETKVANPLDYFKIGDEFHVAVIGPRISKRGVLYVLVSRTDSPQSLAVDYAHSPDRQRSRRPRYRVFSIWRRFAIGDGAHGAGPRR